MRSVENMGLMDKTAIIFTTDHGFYFGEHGGLFGKMSSDKYPDGTLRPYGEPGSQWSYSPLFEEIVHIPLLVHAPGISPGVHQGLSSAIDVMPTVLDLLGMEIPAFVQGKSLVTGLQDTSRYTGVRSKQHSLREPRRPCSICGQPAPIRCQTHIHVYRPENSDPKQLNNVIGTHHQLLVKFMHETKVPDRLLKPRLELRL